MSGTWWLVRRDLLARRKTTLMAGLLVGSAVALCATLELSARAREASTAAVVDLMGPPLRVVAAGVSSLELARFSPTDAVSENLALTLERHVPAIRSVEPRLLARLPVGETLRGVVGIDPRRVVAAAPALRRLGPHDVVLGQTVGRVLAKDVGQTLELGADAFRIRAVLPPQGASDDDTIFVRLAALQSIVGRPGSASELRVYLRAGSQSQAVAGQLRRLLPGLVVLHADRGQIADRELGGTLAAHRHALYLATAVAVLLCLLLLALLDGDERRVEMATLVAVGGTGVSVLRHLTLRAVVIAAGGAFAGLAVAAIVTLSRSGPQAFGSEGVEVFALALLGAAVLASALGSLPAALRVAQQSHVATLQG